MKPANIIISTYANRMGDVIMTLPMAAVLKEHFPEMVVGILGTEYTRPVIEACSNVDVFINKDDFLTHEISLAGQKPDCIIHVKADTAVAKRAKKLAIKQRIGSANRWQHWFTCNRWIWQSRKNSLLHEAQLNLALLKPLGMGQFFSLPALEDTFALHKLPALPDKFSQFLAADKFKLIIHPCSRGSGREWDLQHFADLINVLDSRKFQIFISGTQNEKPAIQALLDQTKKPVTDISGLMGVAEFVSFVAACDGLVASGTGPLHLAAALQKHALGLYPPLKSINPQRWQPIGTKAQFFVADKVCTACVMEKNTCACMQAIQPETVKKALDLLCKKALSEPTDF